MAKKKTISKGAQRKGERVKKQVKLINAKTGVRRGGGGGGVLLGNSRFAGPNSFSYIIQQGQVKLLLSLSLLHA